MDVKELAILLILLVLVVILLRRTGANRGEKTRSARLMKRYAHMTREKLESIPEGEMVDAVVSRVLARAGESRRPDVDVALTELGHGSRVVYTLWAVCKEMATGDFATLRRTATWPLAQQAAEHFRGVGAVACGDAWAALLRCEGDTAEAEAAFRAAVAQEHPLGLCEEYIRDNAEAFLDEQSEEE